MAIRSFEDLIVCQDALKLKTEIQSEFNYSKEFWLKDQLLRACLSISNNIAKGFERETKKEFVRFLFISKASCAEVRSMMHVIKKLNIHEENKSNYLIESTSQISKKLMRLIQSIQSKF